MDSIIEKLTFASQIKAQNSFVGNAPNVTYYDIVMRVWDQADFDFCQKYEGNFFGIMRKNGREKYQEKINMGWGLTCETFEQLASKFTEWYKKHWLENKDNIHYYSLAICLEAIAENERDAEVISFWENILAKVKANGSGYYDDGAHNLLLADGQTITSFDDDIESYQLAFELDIDAYESEDA